MMIVNSRELKTSSKSVNYGGYENNKIWTTCIYKHSKNFIKNISPPVR